MIYAKETDGLKFPMRASQPEADSASVTLKIEGRPEALNPTQAQLFAAIEQLTPLGGPGFLVLERQNGDYAQTAGGDGQYTVEWRDDARLETFRHYVAGKEGSSDLYISIPTNGFQVTAKENECLDASDVKDILSAFLKGESRPNRYRWRDISSVLGGEEIENSTDELATPPQQGDGYSRKYEKKQDEAWAKMSPEDRLWGDPPDIAYTEEEEFEMLRDMDMQPEAFAGKEAGERYRRWLAENPAPPD